MQSEDQAYSDSKGKPNTKEEDDLGNLKVLDEILSEENDKSVQLPVKKDSDLPSDDGDLMDEVLSVLERRGLRKPRRRQRKYNGDDRKYK